ncbi:tetratricopeptide repeat protein [Gymnodinialimonas ceratoperidinii]|uniref:Tetratricopeptide repeat protein n=1 Tax=Gymnodinialimonas ceratoperidinii TaxID=2856823 RepID=A0A8F6TZD7_9RHOB|nr:tetratricopeptide repeat protein [Gymnodinialimonas ceratoperidinii]
MTSPGSIINVIVAAFLCGFSVVAFAAAPAVAQTTVDEYLDRLADPELRNWDVVEADVYQRWQISGSASADYLLRRGLDAMEAEDYTAAYDHLTALTDHAPEFAEGWNARATMFFEQQMFGPAIADIQRVLALEPRHFGALAGLGVMLEDMGDTDGALEAYEAAHAIHPNQPDIQRLLDDLRVQLEGEAL